MAQKTTIYDIAKAASVSAATVSRFIHSPEIVSEKAKQKIQKAFTQLGIEPEDLSVKEKKDPAQTIRTTPSAACIMVCIPQWNNPFYDSILEGIQEYLQLHNYHMIVCGESPRKNTVDEFLETCMSLQVKGLILSDYMPEEVLRQIYARYPLVQCSEYNSFCPDIPHIVVDDYTTSKLAVASLINKGCKKLGFFSAPYEYRYVQQRFRAFKTVLDSNEIELHSEYIIQVADFSYQRILSAARNFFRLPDPPDGIFAVSDKHAHAVVKAASEAGIRMPKELKVIGVDDTMYAALSTPTISTIAQPRREIGVESARLLLTQIEHPKEPVESVMLTSELVFREST